MTKEFGKTRPKFWDEVGGYFEAQAWSRPISFFFLLLSFRALSKRGRR